jgi:hypothetical protein
MATAAPAVGRIDRIIQELERLQAEAQDIFNAHIDYVIAKTPEVIPFGTLKSREIAAPAGNTMNYVAALKIVRKNIAGCEAA